MIFSSVNREFFFRSALGEKLYFLAGQDFEGGYIVSVIVLLALMGLVLST